MSKNPTFCPFCTATQYENIENPSLRLETEFAAPSMFYLSEGAIGHSLHGKFFRVLKYLSDNLHIHNKGWQVETIRWRFYQKKLLTTLSAYTLSWSTWTWLIKISLATRRPHCCVVSFSFQSSKLETLISLDSTWLDHSFRILQFRPLPKNSFHSIHIELRDGQKNPLFLSVSPVSFWCVERPPTIISNQKEDGCFKTSQDSIL